MPKSIRGVMQEFKDGDLHSGSSTGKVVTKRKQAIAIALSEQHPHKNLGGHLRPRGRTGRPFAASQHPKKGR